MAQQIQLRRDTAANWITNNPILAEGELGFETDTLAYKIGDGIKNWNTLLYKELSPVITTSLYTAIPDPTPPAAGFLNVYAKDISGRVLPKFAGPSGLNSVLQPALFGNGIMMISPGLGTAFNVIGMSLPTAVGTVSHPALTGVNQLAQTRRGRVLSAATANAIASLRFASYVCWRGNVPTLGGFFHVNRWAITSTTVNQRCAIGLLPVTSAVPVTQQPSSHINCLVFGWDDTDTNIQVMHNGATGTCTKIDLGPSFPANDPNAVYETTFFAAPSDNKVGYRIKHLITDVEVSGEITTNLPVETVFLAWHAYVNNGGTAAAVSLELMRMYLETDY